MLMYHQTAFQRVPSLFTSPRPVYECCSPTALPALGYHQSLHQLLIFASAAGERASQWLSSKESTRKAGDVGSIPGSGRSLEKGIAIYSSTLAWRIPWTEEPGGPQSIGLLRVDHNWNNQALRHRRKHYLAILKTCVQCITSKTEYLFKWYLAICIFSVICLCPFFLLGGFCFFCLFAFQECFMYYGRLSFQLLKSLSLLWGPSFFLVFIFISLFWFVLV